MNASEVISFGSPQETFLVEYVKRLEPYNMSSNHYHPYYEVYYLLSGKREYFIKDASYTILQGDLVLIDKNELHRTLHAGEAAHERLVIHFDDRFVNGASFGHGHFLLQPFSEGRPVIRFSEPEKETIKPLIKRILREMHEKSAGFELSLSHAILDLLLASARFIQKHECGFTPNNSPAHSRISEVVRYLNARYMEPLTLSGISERFAISPYYLSRMFKGVTGFTLSDYISVTRIKEAERLLRETNMKIIDVAAAVGFENFSHFGKVFKRSSQVSPREYRKRHRV